MPDLISNDPHLDPRAPERVRRTGPSAAWRWRWGIVAVVAALLAVFAFERGLWNKSDQDDDGRDVIRKADANIPAMKIVPVKTEPEPVKPLVEMPTAQPEAAKPAAQAQHGGGTARQLPSRSTFAMDTGGGANPKQAAWFTDGRRPMLAKGCALRPGPSRIQALLITTVQSEIPGQALAQVSEDVLNVDGVLGPDGQPKVLLPQGTMLVGHYESGQLDLMSARLPFRWTEATLPGGRQITLDDANGMDAAGSMGMGGEVTTHWGTLIAAAALFTVFDGIQRSAVGSDNSLEVAFQQAASDNTGRIGRKITERILDGAVTIKIPGGTPIIVSPSKTIRTC